jgi:hypothetical protein
MGFIVIAHTTRSERMADSVKKTDALVALNFIWGCKAAIGDAEYELLAVKLLAAEDYIKNQ